MKRRLMAFRVCCALGLSLAPASAREVLPDLEVLFYDAGIWEKSVEEVLKEREVLGFEWLSRERNDARSSHRGLHLWRQPVGETILRSRDGRLRSLEVSLYNRGDMGPIPMEAFEKHRDGWRKRITGETGIEGELLKERQQGSVVKAERWVWRTPGAYLLLTASVSGEDERRRPEFIKLSLISAKEGGESIDRGLGLAADAKNRRDLRSNVVTSSNGDVRIDGVPMVDQGRKGYCAVASAERVFRYYGMPIDQHAMAQIAQSSAAGGTNPVRMIDALKRVTGQTRTRLHTHYEIDAGRYSSVVRAYNRLVEDVDPRFVFPRESDPIPIQPFLAGCHGPTLSQAVAKGNRYDRFRGKIEEFVDNGVPLLWALQVGVFPEPGIPQQGGGHMRLIIGYNTKTGEVLYTDSWGAGHELKRMKMTDAFAVTIQLITIQPAL
ncbi:hypothetical protein [Haloferula sp. A504]|uniref:hypothetical protein n=1 Tax=Haloferula sp. A504 TaxID=3373601 RepID=UPI0031C0E897|nr:hypothetical protein [Verrucomicrobiaceae bacterium E54]